VTSSTGRQAWRWRRAARGRGGDAGVRSAAAAEALLLDVVRRHADALLRVARSHSLCDDDAHDAYQRSLEQFLRTGAGSTPRPPSAGCSPCCGTRPPRSADPQPDGRFDEVDLERLEARHDASPEDRALDADAIRAAPRRSGAQAAGGPRAVAARRRPLLRRDPGGHGLDLHEGQPLLARGRRAYLRRCADLEADGLRAVARRCSSRSRRRGRGGGPRGAAAAPAALRGLPGEPARAARQRRVDRHRAADRPARRRCRGAARRGERWTPRGAGSRGSTRRSRARAGAGGGRGAALAGRGGGAAGGKVAAVRRFDRRPAAAARRRARRGPVGRARRARGPRRAPGARAQAAPAPGRGRARRTPRRRVVTRGAGRPRGPPPGARSRPAAGGQPPGAPGATGVRCRRGARRPGEFDAPEPRPARAGSRAAPVALAAPARPLRPRASRAPPRRPPEPSRGLPPRSPRRPHPRPASPAPGPAEFA
jgi:hypothetical protein